jgi:hypothetical protein
MPPSLRRSTPLPAPPPTGEGGYYDGYGGDAADDGHGDDKGDDEGDDEGEGEGEGDEDADCFPPSDPLFTGSSPLAWWKPKTVDTLITDDTNPTTAERRRTADRTDNFVSLGKALNRQRAVRSPRAASLLAPTAAPLRYALMLDETTAPIMGVSTAKKSVPGSSTQRDVRSANTPPPTPKTTISLMLNGACPEGWACWGGGTGSSASGVGTCAARWTGLPQFEQ